ncbi:lytic transglycosylase domain-containing protein [Rhodococcoides kroppenstedtii]|uniref:lytic transglycosylase domain-containing protein n=1 Tax=Rhodococcoides kroppenstedtii TaxID=293050 RepID=UPI003627EE86
MGRHRKKSTSALRRNSVIALTGLLPAGGIAVASSYAAGADIPFLQTRAASHEVPLDASRVEATPAAAPTSSETPPPAPEPAPAPVIDPGPALPESVVAHPLGVPAVNVQAYRNAERILHETLPGCTMSWSLLAGIGRVESTHANDGKVAPDGTLLEPILGPRLDGSLAGNNVIYDTDRGELDGDPVYDRAVGPMQFLPETWKRYATDGNGDGKADPQNLFDSAATTGKYLCDGGLNMADPVQATQAILRYNNSMAYVANVVAWSVAYSTGIAPAEGDLPRIH